MDRSIKRQRIEKMQNQDYIIGMGFTVLQFIFVAYVTISLMNMYAGTGELLNLVVIPLVIFGYKSIRTPNRVSRVYEVE